MLSWLNQDINSVLITNVEIFLFAPRERESLLESWSLEHRLADNDEELIGLYNNG